MGFMHHYQRWGGYHSQRPPTPLLDTINYPIHIKNLSTKDLPGIIEGAKDGKGRGRQDKVKSIKSMEVATTHPKQQARGKNKHNNGKERKEHSGRPQPCEAVVRHENHRGNVTVPLQTPPTLLFKIREYSPCNALRSRWREYHGSNDWKGMLDPFDENLRREVVRYVEFVQAAYHCFHSNPAMSA